MAYETGLTGADKFFHCAANYEAAKRGMSEGELAINLSRNREIFQALGPDADLQDASDDMAANLRGKRGRKREKRYGIVVRAIPANITNSFYRLFNENFAGKEERWRLRSDIKVRGFWGDCCCRYCGSALSFCLRFCLL